MVTRSHNVNELHFQLRSKAVLHSDEMDLYELSQLAGITMDPQIFKIILDLLKLNVSPAALASTLHSMCQSRTRSRSSGDSSHTSYLSHTYSSHERMKKSDHQSGRTVSLPNSSSSLMSDNAKKSYTSARSHVSSKDSRNHRKLESSYHHSLTDEQLDRKRFTVSNSVGTSSSGSSSRVDNINFSSSSRH